MLKLHQLGWKLETLAANQQFRHLSTTGATEHGETSRREGKERRERGARKKGEPRRRREDCGATATGEHIRG